MSIAKPWADGPFQLISSSKSGDSRDNPVKGTAHLAADMTLVHNAFIRGMNAVYLQCLNVDSRGTSKDKSDFTNFAYLWSELVLSHHELEETKIFPKIDEFTGVPGLMDGNIEEHASFHDGITRYQNYLTKVKNNDEAYNGDKLKGIIDSFMPTLRAHLENEIDSLVAMKQYEDKCDWGTWYDNLIGGLARTAMGEARYRYEVFPLAIIFHDKTFEDGVWQNFPPIPWAFIVMLRWLFMRRNQDWWRFAGCDFYSMPKDLPFA